MPTPVFVHLGDLTVNLAALGWIQFDPHGATIEADGLEYELEIPEAAALRRLLAETPSGFNPPFKVVAPCVPANETPRPESPADDGDDWTASNADRDEDRADLADARKALAEGGEPIPWEQIKEAIEAEAAGTEAVGEVRGGPVS